MKYGFIGCGNMGGALAMALAKATKDICICDHRRSEELAQLLGCISGTDREAASCDRVFIGVKPNKVCQALAPVQDILAERKPVLISMAAGLELSTVEKYARSSLPIIRIMPNTPVAVGKGMIGYTCNSLVKKEILDDFLGDMADAGVWDAVEEALMDTVAALSGSGPAYTYYFAEALCRGAVKCGMKEDQALRYAIATLEGAAEMMKQGDHTPEQLRIAVCSPGGSTLAGLKTLDDAGFPEAVSDCIQAAHDRNKELSRM